MRKSSDYQKGKRFPKKKFFKKKSPNSKSEQKKCRCWLCRALGHYANECPKIAKPRDAKIFEEYEEAVEAAQLKNLEVVYTLEDDESVDSILIDEEAELSSKESSKEGESHPIFILQIKNWEDKKDNTNVYGFKPNSGRFTCDSCNCKENAVILLFCKATGETYHKECPIAEERMIEN